MSGAADGSKKKGDGRKIIVDNRKARHDFHVIETFEAGLALQGTEVKSIRAGHVAIREAYVTLRDGNAFVVGMNVLPYEQGNIHNHEPLRDRQLLLHQREIDQIHEHITRKGNTVVPLQLYFVGSRAKLAIAIARGKQKHDRRQDIIERDTKRQVEREMKQYGR